MQLRSIFLIGMMAFICQVTHAQPLYKGITPPAWALKDTTGRIFTPDSLKGHITIVDFWASWCRPCKYAIATLKSLHKRYASYGVQFVSISTDKQYSAWHTALVQEKMNWLQLNDPEEKTAKAWGVNGVPFLFLLDKNGVILSVDPSYENLVWSIEALIDSEQRQ